MMRKFRTRRAIGTALLAVAVHLACYGQSETNDAGKPTGVAHEGAVREPEPGTTLAALNVDEQPIDTRVIHDKSNSDASIDVQAATPAVPSPATGTAPKVKPGFFARWGNAYLMDWKGTTPTDPNAPQRRGTPTPADHPIECAESGAGLSCHSENATAPAPGSHPSASGWQRWENRAQPAPELAAPSPPAKN